VSYSSPGFNLAGYILGKVAGQPYEQYLREVIFNPLGMETTTIGRAEENRELLATGYNVHGEPVPVWYDYDEPAGALNTSVYEMALFVQCMLNLGRVDDRQVIDSALIGKIGQPTSSLAAQAGLQSGYSFGIGVTSKDTLKWYTHGGIVPGFFADYAYNYDCGVGYVVLINKFDFMVYNDFMELARRYLACNARPAIAPAVAIDGEQLGEYCGYYEPRSPRMQLTAFTEILMSGKTVYRANDTLYEQEFMGEANALIPVAPHLFRRTDEPQATRAFVENADGRMVLATRGSYYEKTAAWKPLLYRTLVFGALLVLISSLVYAVFWLPVHVYKKIRSKGRRSPYLRMRVVPLLAVLALVAGIMVFASAEQTLLEFGSKTTANVLLYLATLLFAGLSTLSLFTTWRSLTKPVTKTARVYAVLLTSACFGMTLYLGYWGIIGLKMWAY
jgi:hypothetical protein